MASNPVLLHISQGRDLSRIRSNCLKDPESFNYSKSVFNRLLPLLESNGISFTTSFKLLGTEPSPKTNYVFALKEKATALFCANNYSAPFSLALSVMVSRAENGQGGVSILYKQPKTNDLKKSSNFNPLKSDLYAGALSESIRAITEQSGFQIPINLLEHVNTLLSLPFPSLRLELGVLPHDKKLLANLKYQETLARGIVNGIKNILQA